MAASYIRVFVWIVWFLAAWVALGLSDRRVTKTPTTPLLGVVLHDAKRSGPLFPWQATRRWKKWALHQYRAGRTADQATVETNLNNLATWLRNCGKPLHETLVVGDRVRLSAEIALTDDRVGVRHLTGLKAATPELKALIGCWSDPQIEAFPLVEGSSPADWGRGCQVPLPHAGQSATHKGLVVVAGPLRDQLRQTHLTWLGELEAALEQIRSKIGQPRLCSLKAIERKVNARLRESKAAGFMAVTVYTTPTGQITLHWRRNQEALAERCEGRSLLVTNDRSLSHHEMFRLYRQKDGVEKCFHISKDDLDLSPLYLHKDKRISTMLFVNRVALLACTLFQLQQQGLHMTTGAHYCPFGTATHLNSGRISHSTNSFAATLTRYFFSIRFSRCEM